MRFKKHYLKFVFLSIRNIFAGFVILLSIYFISAVFLSVVPVNSDFKESKKDTYFIYLASNGVHIDIILPASDTMFNWVQTLPFEHSIYPLINYIGFGWGNKEFYINTPYWSDLNATTAVNALFLKGESALHVSPYRTIVENENVIKLNITQQEYEKLNQFIYDSFKKNSFGGFEVIEGLNYGIHDAFFVANHNYHLFNTCNSWTNKGLKTSGLKACLWTPFDRGILYQYRNFRKNL